MEVVAAKIERSEGILGGSNHSQVHTDTQDFSKKKKARVPETQLSTTPPHKCVFDCAVRGGGSTALLCFFILYSIQAPLLTLFYHLFVCVYVGFFPVVETSQEKR